MAVTSTFYSIAVFMYVHNLVPRASVPFPQKASRQVDTLESDAQVWAYFQLRPQGICCLSAKGFTASRFRVTPFISSRNTNGPENQVCMFKAVRSGTASATMV